MMKKIFSAIIALILFVSFSIIAFSKEDFTAELNDEYSEKIFSSLSDEAKEIFDSSGIEFNDAQSLVNLSPKDVIRFFLNCISKKILSPTKNISIILILLCVVSVCFTYIDDDIKSKKYLNMILSVIIFFIISKSIISLIRASCATLNTVTSLMNILLPILAGLIAASGNALLAFSLNSTTIYLSNIITYFTNKILSSFTLYYFVLSVSSATFTSIDISRLCNSIKNAIIKILGIISSFFISFLSLKGLLANNIDTLSLKGTKLLISNIIPVIGSNISEAYTTVSYSLSLLKSSVGIMGIIAVLSISLPMIIEISLYNLSFFICENIAVILNLENLPKLFEAICSVIKILNLIIIFSSVVLIISIGIMIRMRGGG